MLRFVPLMIIFFVGFNFHVDRFFRFDKWWLMGDFFGEWIQFCDNSYIQLLGLYKKAPIKDVLVCLIGVTDLVQTFTCYFLSNQSTYLNHFSSQEEKATLIIIVIINLEIQFLFP